MTSSSRLRPGPGPASTGPRSASRDGDHRRPLLATLLSLAAVVGCATGAPAGPGPGPSPDAAPDDDAPADARDAGVAALDEVRRLLDAGRYRASALRADSLYFRAVGRPGLGDVAAEALSREAEALSRAGDHVEAAARLRDLLRAHPEHAGDDVPVRLARLSISLADDPAAAEALLRWRTAGGGRALRLAQQAGQAMSVGELESVLGRAGAEGASTAGPVRAALLAELAVARARAGLAEEARSAARRALASDPPRAVASRARSVLDGSVGPRSGPIRIGLLVPRSGRFASVGERLLEGVQLALEGHDGPRPVELSTADTGPDGEPLEQLVAGLEKQGVVAVVGPVQAGGLQRAAAARADSGLLVVSPTATRMEARGPAVFTLWDRRRKELEAARRLGSWMAEVLGSVPVGAVYPADATGRRAYLEFRRALAPGRAWMAAAHPYEPGATTLEGAITAVSAFGPRAVFAPGGSSTSVLQMAPQLSYYGIRGALVAGGPDWSRPSTVRRLEPSFSQRRILATFVDRDARDGAWSRFKAAYEKEHRRTLSGNVLPALGHDAALWVLDALDAVRPARPRAVARRAAALDTVRGATGHLRPDPGSGTVARRVLVTALEDRRLRPASREAAREWLASSGRFEAVRIRNRREQARAAVEASGIPLARPGGGGS